MTATGGGRLNLPSRGREWPGSQKPTSDRYLRRMEMYGAWIFPGLTPTRKRRLPETRAAGSGAVTGSGTRTSRNVFLTSGFPRMTSACRIPTLQRSLDKLTPEPPHSSKACGQCSTRITRAGWLAGQLPAEIGGDQNFHAVSRVECHPE